LETEFNAYFSSIYGTRWTALLEALRKEEEQICYSPFSKTPLKSYLKIPKDYFFGDKQAALEREPAGHLRNYILDPSSLAPVCELEVQPQDRVLDLCAAPGGKSLALLSQLGEGGALMANDSSKARFERLRKVLFQYTPSDHPALRQVVCKDGTRFGFFHKGEFSKILVDAPCSSERHHLFQGKEKEWKEKRARFLAVKQYTLLCAALLCAAEGARLVYSTCSINPVENDGVVKKFLKKKGERLKWRPSQNLLEGEEETEFGKMILPDRSGFGPIYRACFEVISP